MVFKYLSAIKKKKKLLMNKPVYLGLSILDISKIVMHEYWYDYVKLKHKDKGRLCYMDTDSFIACTKIEDIYKDLNNHVN